LPKFAVASSALSKLGLAGDGHRNTQVHGGPRQAVLIVTLEGIEELKAAGFQLYPGAMGENITSKGLDRRAFRPGQRYRVGSEVILEITKPRAPCSNLNVYSNHLGAAVYDAKVKKGDASSPHWGLGGFYASVVREGVLHPGDPILFLDQLV
jgi:MOSC domain-containing protein YiiM